MSLKFVTGKPALVIGHYLIIAELHFGIEISLAAKGLRLHVDPKEYAKELNDLQKETGTDTLVVAGDFKHTITGFEPRERSMFEQLIANLHFNKIIIVLGNHDSKIDVLSRPFKKIQIAPADGLLLTDESDGKTYGITHGHAWPTGEMFKAEVLITAHNHPGVRISDGEKFSRLSQAWIVGNMKTNKEHGTTSKQKVIVIPSFNKYSGSTAFNEMESKEIHGPIFQNKLVDLGNCEAILLSGQRIGKLKFLKPQKQKGRTYKHKRG